MSIDEMFPTASKLWCWNTCEKKQNNTSGKDLSHKSLYCTSATVKIPSSTSWRMRRWSTDLLTPLISTDSPLTLYWLSIDSQLTSTNSACTDSLLILCQIIFTLLTPNWLYNDFYWFLLSSTDSLLTVNKRSLCYWYEIDVLYSLRQ